MGAVPPRRRASENVPVPRPGGCRGGVGGSSPAGGVVGGLSSVPKTAAGCVSVSCLPRHGEVSWVAALREVRGELGDCSPRVPSAARAGCRRPRSSPSRPGRLGSGAEGKGHGGLRGTHRHIAASRVGAVPVEDVGWERRFWSCGGVGLLGPGAGTPGSTASHLVKDLCRARGVPGPRCGN